MGNHARLPIHVGDFETDTRHLTPAELGAYWRLIMAYWRRRGPLPLDHGRLARIAGMRVDNWHRRTAPVVLALFEQIEGHLWHKRLEIEIALLQGRELRTRKLSGHTVQDQGLIGAERESWPSSLSKSASTCQRKAKEINDRPVEIGTPARASTHTPLKRSPSCSLGVSDSGAGAAAGPGATNQGLGRGSCGRSAQEPPVQPIDLDQLRRRDLEAEAKPPAPSRSERAPPGARRGGGMRELNEVLERFGRTVAQRRRE